MARNRSLGRLDLDEVQAGVDGWLFLQTGSNQVLQLFSDPDAYPDSLNQAWHELLNGRTERFHAAGIRYLHVVAPDKMGVFPHLFGKDLPNQHQSPLRRLANPDTHGGVPTCLVDPTLVLREGRGKLLTYFKTDSHWTIWGAYLTYRMICERLGISQVVDFYSHEMAGQLAVFDLGGKLSPQVTEEVFFWPSSAHVTRLFANDQVRAREAAESSGGEMPGHHGTHVILRNWSPQASPETVVMFGDSFSDYRPSSLTYLLAETFKEVHFVWSADVDFSYASRVGANIVLSEIAERFMTRLPSDDIAVGLPST